MEIDLREISATRFQQQTHVLIDLGISIIITTALTRAPSHTSEQTCNQSLTHPYDREHHDHQRTQSDRHNTSSNCLAALELFERFDG